MKTIDPAFCICGDCRSGIATPAHKMTTTHLIGVASGKLKNNSGIGIKMRIKQGVAYITHPSTKHSSIMSFEVLRDMSKLVA